MKCVETLSCVACRGSSTEFCPDNGLLCDSRWYCRDQRFCTAKSFDNNTILSNTIFNLTKSGVLPIVSSTFQKKKPKQNKTNTEERLPNQSWLSLESSDWDFSVRAKMNHYMDEFDDFESKQSLNTLNSPPNSPLHSTTTWTWPYPIRDNTRKYT